MYRKQKIEWRQKPVELTTKTEDEGVVEEEGMETDPLLKSTQDVE